MEGTRKVKEFDQGLRKYIEKGIQTKELIKCNILMGLQQLKKFYGRMQQKIYSEKLKKHKRSRIFSQPSQIIFSLQDTQHLKVINQPSFGQSKKNKISTKRKEQKQVQSRKQIGYFRQVKATKKTESIFLQSTNYYVRKIKNPKAHRYISLKPDEQKSQQKQNWINEHTKEWQMIKGMKNAGKSQMQNYSRNQQKQNRRGNLVFKKLIRDENCSRIFCRTNYNKRKDLQKQIKKKAMRNSS